MAVQLRLYLLLLLLASALACSSARNTILLSGAGDETVVAAMEGRSLKVSIDDYSDPSANKGHDPRNKVGGGGGRKNRDSP